MRWRIYYESREYAREHGDPCLGVVEAATKAEAEDAARKQGLGGEAGVWAKEEKGPTSTIWRWMRVEYMDAEQRGYRYAYVPYTREPNSWEVREVGKRSARWALYNDCVLVGFFHYLCNAKCHVEKALCQKLQQSLEETRKLVDDLKARGIVKE